MDFERYRVPRSVSEGVPIDLPGTEGATFLVALPSEHNRAFAAAQQRALMEGGTIALGADNKPEFNGVDFLRYRDARIEAFLEHCILQLPDGITRDLLRTDYYPGLVALFDAATDLAESEAAKGEAATKKLRA
jgi:hypothetical protein